MATQNRTRHPVRLPRGLVDLGLIAAVDIVEKDGRVVLNRDNGEPLMFLSPDTFGGEFTDDPVKIARQFSRMVVAVAKGERVETPDWLPEDEHDF